MTDLERVVKQIQQIQNNISGDGTVWVTQLKKAMAELLKVIEEHTDKLNNLAERIVELERKSQL